MSRPDSIALLRAIVDAHAQGSPSDGRREPVLCLHWQGGSALQHQHTVPEGGWPDFDDALLEELRSQGLLDIGGWGADVWELTPTELGRTTVEQHDRANAPIRRAGDRYFQRRRQTPPRPSARPTTMFFARRPACPVRTGSPGRREPRCPVKLARETAFPCHAASPLCRVRRLEHPVHCGGSGTSAPLAAGNYGAAAGPGRHRPCRRRIAVLRRGHRRRRGVPRLEAPAGDWDGLHLIGTGHARPIASGHASTVDSWGHWKSRSAESSAATSLRA